MKDPTGEHDVTEIKFMDGSGYAFCSADSETWPCPTIRKWRKSKDFRIRELDAMTETLARELAQAAERIAVLEQNITTLNDAVRVLMYPTPELKK